MSTNKKVLLIFSIFLCFFSFTVVDASVINNVVLLGAEYVGENICAEASIQKILKLVGIILIIVKVLVPLILIFLGTYDLFQAVVGKDDKALTKSIKTLILRVVAGIFIFFIPSVVNWAIDVMYETAGGENNKQCIECVLDVDKCNTSGTSNNSGNNGSNSDSSNTTSSDKEELCQSGYTKGLDGGCYDCSTYKNQLSCPSACTWNETYGCHSIVDYNDGSINKNDNETSSESEECPTGHTKGLDGGCYDCSTYKDSFSCPSACTWNETYGCHSFVDIADGSANSN